jgi:acetylornithine deacetylase/succinyl-diaminopimelate desuccinylase-like protein
MSAEESVGRHAQTTKRGRTLGGDRPQQADGSCDPNWRLFARSASDDKGPIAMFLTAFDVLGAAGLDPAINVCQ